MKPKAKLSLAIALMMFILITLCLTKISGVERKLLELGVELQNSCNMSVSTTCAPILSGKAKMTNVTRTNNENDRLRVNNQLELVNHSENITRLRVCASQWLDGVITVRETLHCIDEYATRASGPLEPRQ